MTTNYLNKDKTLRVVWISHVSNQKIRDHLSFKYGFIERIVRKLLHRPRAKYVDCSQWITNGLNEYEKISDIELHLIAPHLGIKGVQEFVLDGIHYHFFRSEDDYPFIKRLLIKKKKFNSEYIKNRSIIKSLIDRIKPDIVHVFGAENPKYSLAALDVDNNKIPLIVSLQTLLAAPGFMENYPISKEEYKYRSLCEERVLKYARYIGNRVEMYKRVIWEKINPSVVFLNTTLFVGETIDKSFYEIKYDLIYFAKDIAKAGDIVLNTMAEIVKLRPNVLLCVVGGCTENYKLLFKNSIQTLGLKDNVVYLGCLTTHQDVLDIVRHSRVAFLPVKVDGITGTMREALANGIPLVTTKTWGTPSLNEKRKCAFIEPQDDYCSLAKDVISLLEDHSLYDKMRWNCFMTFAERYSNEAFLMVQNSIYCALIKNIKDGIPIPEDLCSYNLVANASQS